MLINLRNALMGKRLPTAKDYVQSGLVAMWDGIENAGWGQHNPSATTWKDLVGGNYFTIPANTQSVRYSWENGALVGSGSNLSIGSNNTFSAQNELTFEVVGAVNAVPNLSGYACVAGNAQVRPIFLYPTKLTYIYLASVGTAAFGTAPLARLSAAVTSGSANSVFYSNGASVLTSSLHVSFASNKVWVFGYQGTSSASNPWGDGGNVECSAIRIYSRALTASEIARNYAIDKARFGLL